MYPMRRLFWINYFDRYVTNELKTRSHRILRLWSQHCEYIIAQRFRRSQQIICLYRRLWDDQALRGLVQQLRKQLERHAKNLMLSGIGISTAFDWDSERISYDAVRKNFDELELVRRLRLDTIYCDDCGHRLIIDGRIDGISYCACAENTCAAKANRVAKLASSLPTVCCKQQWQPYLERPNVIVWRREEQSGLFAYKVHVAYDDVSAEEFLHVQTDDEYRKTWDKSAVALDVIDTDPVYRNKSQVVYWEMQWPKLFANRDYVYNRRFFVDRNRKQIIIINKSVEHPSSPSKPNIQRVHEYWSYMIIHSTSTSLRTPGVEYVLTYFENPGVALPQKVQSWVAQKQMPEYLHRLHLATIEYAKDRRLQQQQEHELHQLQKHQHQHHHAQHHNHTTDESRFTCPDPGYEYPPDPELRFTNQPRSDDGDDTDDDDNEDSDDTDEHVVDTRSKRDNRNCLTSDKSTNNRNNIGVNDSINLVRDQTHTVEQSDTNAKPLSWWRYLLPFNLFV